MPLPGIAPVIVAALLITDNMKAPELEGLTSHILDGLLDRGLHVVSAACDGTETKRGVQKLLLEHARSRRTYLINSPTIETDIYKLSVDIAVIKENPIVMVQDSQHG